MQLLLFTDDAINIFSEFFLQKCEKTHFLNYICYLYSMVVKLKGSTQTSQVGSYKPKIDIYKFICFLYLKILPLHPDLTGNLRKGRLIKKLHFVWKYITYILYCQRKK
jgi:hypothetical protein